MKFKFTKMILLVSLISLPLFALASCSSSNSVSSNVSSDNKVDTIINNIDLDVSRTKFSNLNINEFDVENIKSLILEYAVSGKKNDIQTSDIIVNSTNKSEQLNQISGTFRLNKYWENDEIKNQETSEFTYKLTKFKLNEQSTNDISKGGTFNNLNISSYLEVIKVLDVSSNTPIFKITNEYIRQKLSVSKFNNINLTITEGNESNGNIKLIISGSYNNNSITEAEITVSGFKNFASIIDISSQMKIKTMELNLNNYYGNLQDNDSISNWTSDDWLNKYLSKLEINKETNIVNDNINVIDLYKQNIISNISFNDAQNLLSKDKSNFNIQFTISKKVYNNSSSKWIDSSETESFTIYLENNYIFSMPSENDAIKYILNNQSTYNNNLISQEYASYSYSQIFYNCSIDYLTKFITLNKTYVDKYLPNMNVRLCVENINSVTVNDKTGQIIGSVIVYFNQNRTNVEHNINIAGFKKSYDYINQNNQEYNNFFTPNDTAKINRYIKMNILSQKSIDDINNIQINNSIEINNKVYLSQSNSQGLIYREAIDHSTPGEINAQIINDWSFTFLGTNFTDITMNKDNNLYKNEFIIKNINYDFGSNSRAVILRLDNDRISYTVNFTLSIELLSSNDFITINTSYKSILNINDLK